MQRRVFLGSALAGLPLTGAFAAQPKSKAWEIPTTTLGRTGVRVQVVAQGGARMDLHPDIPAAAAYVRETLRPGPAVLRLRAHVLERPIGGSVRPGLQGVRKDVFLTSKSVGRTAKDAEKDLETSFRLLKTDHLDLWQMHNIQGREDVEAALKPGGAMETFEAAKKAGKCRFIGFTGHFDPEAHAAHAEGVRQVGHRHDAGARGRSRLPELRADCAARRGRTWRGDQAIKISGRPTSSGRSAPATASAMRSASRACRWPSAAAALSARWRTTSGPSRTSGR